MVSSPEEKQQPRVTLVACVHVRGLNQSITTSKQFQIVPPTSHIRTHVKSFLTISPFLSLPTFSILSPPPFLLLLLTARACDPHLYPPPPLPSPVGGGHKRRRRRRHEAATLQRCTPQHTQRVREGGLQSAAARGYLLAVVVSGCAGLQSWVPLVGAGLAICFCHLCS